MAGEISATSIFGTGYNVDLFRLRIYSLGKSPNAEC
jgi:hypothetical protein